MVPGSGRESRLPTALAAAWSVWALAVSVNVVIWLLVSLSAGDLKHFWPMWVAGPWGVVLGMSTFAARRAGHGGCSAG